MRCPGKKCQCSDPVYCHRGCPWCKGTGDVDLHTFVRYGILAQHGKPSEITSVRLGRHSHVYVGILPEGVSA